MHIRIVRVLLLAAILAVFAPASIRAQVASPRDFDLVVYEEKPMFTRDVLSPSLVEAMEPLRETVDAPGLFEAILFIVDFRRAVNLLGCEDDMRDYLITTRNLDIGSETTPLEPYIAFDLQSYDPQAIAQKLSSLQQENEIYTYSEKCFLTIIDGTFIFAPSSGQLHRDPTELLMEFKQQQSLLSENYQHFGFVANRQRLKELLQQWVRKSYLVGLDRCLDTTISFEISGNDRTGLYQLVVTCASEADAEALERLIHGYNDLWLAHHLACGRTHEKSNRELHDLFAPLGRILQDLRFASEGTNTTVSLSNIDEHMDDVKEQRCILNKMTVGEAAKRYIYAKPENKDLVMDKLLEAGLPATNMRCPSDNKLFTIKPIHTEVERGFAGMPGVTDPYGHTKMELEVICPIHGALKP